MIKVNNQTLLQVIKEWERMSCSFFMCSFGYNCRDKMKNVINKGSSSTHNAKNLNNA